MKRLLLPLILFIAFVLRVVWLDKVPYGFTPDEASFGYDAYSILKTGADQWGHKFPLVLESFGDYKAPLYSYLSIPFVVLMGLTKVAVRLPNALLGTAAIYVTYLLVRELFGSGLTRIRDGINAEIMALIAAFLLAISPWHIMMSRGAFEANLATFFLPLGILLFLRGLKNPKFLVWSALALGLNLFTYHSAKLVTPIIVGVLLLIFRREVKKISFKQILPASAIFGISLVLTVYTFSLGAGARAKDVSIFRGALEEASPARLAAANKGMPPLLARFLHNKYQVAVRRFLDNYKTYLSAKFLFISGPAEATYGMIPGRGVLYRFELPFLFGFLVALFKKKSPELLLITGWIVFAPIPASLATGVGYAANRAVIMLPALQVAEAYGAIYLYDAMKRELTGSYSRWIAVGYSVVTLLFLLTFIKNYAASPVKTAEDMLYGNLEVAYWLKQNIKSEKVVVSRKLSEPQIYVAFANEWNPNDYQKATRSWNYKKGGLGWVDQMSEYKLGNYTFGSIEWSKEKRVDAYLVGRPDEFPETVLPIEIFKYPSGEPAIFVVNPKLTKYAQKIYSSIQ